MEKSSNTLAVILACSEYIFAWIQHIYVANMDFALISAVVLQKVLLQIYLLCYLHKRNKIQQDPEQDSLPEALHV